MMGRDLPQLMFLFLYGCTSVKGIDPCTDNEVLRFQDSRCPSNLLAGNSPGLCDNFITERWYRVDEGSDIPTSCQNLLQCGTIYPVWMYGSVPTVSDGEVYRTACFSDHNGCCSRQWLIRVKNCGSYRVYDLKRPDACSSAYCIEKRLYTTTSEETSSSSSSQDVTSTSMESIESGNIDATTTSETTTDIPTTTTSVSTISRSTTSRSTATRSIVPSTAPKSTSRSTATRSIVPSTAPKSIVTDPQILNNEDLKTSPPIYPESTQSQVVQAGPTNILVYILAVAVGVLLLTTLVIAVVLHIFRRKRKKEKQNIGETSEASKQPQNGYSELPNSETIYYSIEYDKEAENNKENERIASAQEGDMYLDACHQLAVSDVDVKYDVASEIEEVSALGNREMYLDAIRGSVINPPGHNVTGRPENTYHDPYECSIRDTESHSYAKLPNTMLKTQHEYCNGGYEPEQQDKKRKSTVECANRGSIVSYDDVTFDLK